MDDLARNQLRTRLHSDRFPRSSRYDAEWVLANEMGPNALWLTEALCGQMALDPGMRVLDLGCGRAISSIFLAREYGLRVWANDLWIDADDNWRRIRDAGLEHAICPIRAEAHQLPYAAEFFDAIVSIDSYQYYGTDDLYLGYLTRFLRTGGQLGVVVPGLITELEGEPPAHLTERQASGAVFWDPSECWCLHTVDWWRRHFERSGLVDIVHAEPLADGCQLWLQWERARDGGGYTGFPSDAEALEKDGGRHLGFDILVARKRARDAGPHPHPLLVRLGERRP